MPKMQIKIIDCATGEEILRDMTNEEIAQRNKQIEESEALIKAEKDKSELRSQLLAKLGLTEDEAKVLLG